MNIAVVGSRDFYGYSILEEAVDKFIKNNKIKSVTIISGGARGADSLAEMYAQKRGYKIKIHEADWDKYGKRAGMMRNEQIIKDSRHILAFWDMESVGTSHTIRMGEEAGLNVIIYDMSEYKVQAKDIKDIKLGFGKYKNKTVQEVVDEDQSYLEWVMESFDSHWLIDLVKKVKDDLMS